MLVACSAVLATAASRIRCVAQANGPAHLHSSTATGDILTVDATSLSYDENLIMLETDATSAPANVLQFSAGSTALLDVRAAASACASWNDERFLFFICLLLVVGCLRWRYDDASRRFVHRSRRNGGRLGWHHV
jgi:hypothetical protein